ncbi:hypothetical protein BCV70DRAFT_114766 [Testicularia cyperi]|uniref:BHLH domain-containing protein n=1 Tax=Testicularia cyperi TaxID=1882483 RepID=A0A317XEZ7_9BASI|nr:hypothetical protein BCV70DRAFT_114766 [Testicularia cyperi]
MDASGHEIKKPPTKEEEEEEAEKEKKTHTLLTTEEKKANHIASEQKRRANIRKGYELLCEIVPSLREALEREAKKSKGGANRDGSSDEEDDEGDSGDEDGKGSVGKKSGSPSKKKVSGSSGKKGGSSGKDDDGGIEIDGEKIDGRAGPRSEAVVLMKSLDHIAVLLEKYRALLGRRNRARLALARKHGWTGLARQPVPDIERLLKLKVEEYFAAHGLESDDVESAERDTDLMHDD